VHDKLLNWVQNGKVNLSDWISHVLDWNQYEQALELIKEKKADKIILKL
jgi:threonine dehydrogenase-like Zn-dependent dehydrogenase